jgi:hypothetical protein
LFFNWVIQAAISFLFGGLGPFVAFRFSLNLEKKREEREKQRKNKTSSHRWDSCSCQYKYSRPNWKTKLSP